MGHGESPKKSLGSSDPGNRVNLHIFKMAAIDKDDQQSQWEMPNRGLLAPKPESIFRKICTVDYVVDPTPHANVGVNRFKGGVSAHA